MNPLFSLHGITHRKNGNSVVSVSREFVCGFLTAEIAPI
jgi:hypothetical protein